MRDAGDHAADLGPVRQRVRLADAAETECPQRAAVLRLGADARLHLRDLQTAHHATSFGMCGPRWVSWYARHSAGGMISSGDRPRSLATSSGRRSACSPATVARATLMWLDEPSDLQSTSWMPASSRIWRAAPP